MSSGDDAATAAELVEVADLPRMLGVSRGRAYIISRDKRFPDPWYDGQTARLWRRSEVEDYIARYRPAD